MGVCLSSIAVRQKSPEAIHAALGLRPTQKSGHYTDHKFSAVRLPSGWYLVCLRRHEFSDTELERISSDSAEVVACFVEEHVMFSKAAGWADGLELWSVTHSSETDLKHLEVHGTPPTEFVRIRDELFAKQTSKTCDYVFDIPISLLAEIIGYRYDEWPQIDFQALEKQSVFRKLFGK